MRRTGYCEEDTCNTLGRMLQGCRLPGSLTHRPFPFSAWPARCLRLACWPPACSGAASRLLTLDGDFSSREIVAGRRGGPRLSPSRESSELNAITLWCRRAKRAPVPGRRVIARCLAHLACWQSALLARAAAPDGTPTAETASPRYALLYPELLTLPQRPSDKRGMSVCKNLQEVSR